MKHYDIARLCPLTEPSSRAAAGRTRWPVAAAGLFLLLLFAATSQGAFLESAGLVVMEAENYYSSSPGSGHAWTASAGVAGYVGASAMQAAPNTGITIGPSAIANSPRLNYQVQFATAGSYRFWIRGFGPSGSDDSVYLGADGRTNGVLSYTPVGAWMWRSLAVTVTNPGLHEINVWMREDGAWVDRLLLTTNAAYTPTGDGPPESAQSGGGGPGGPPPTLQIVSPADGAVFPAGTTVPVSAEVSDPNGRLWTVDFYLNGMLGGSDATAPYAYNWNPLAGDYQLVAVAGNSLGIMATSAPVRVTVTAPAATFRWASTSRRIYVTGPGTATLTDIKLALPNAPLTLVDAANRIWYLGANLFVEKGAKLELHGPTIGGDVAELRLKSDNTSAADAIVEVRADWGWLDIRSTKITSWDSAVNGPDTEVATYRRAYVRARSTLDPDGVTARESRMDIMDSDVGYLGSFNTEAYGVVWKVVDTTAVYLPPGSTNTLFDLVNVYGDIRQSRLHHNYFGIYSYGHFGGQWVGNEVDHNIGYGFDPHDDSDYLVIENNNVHHNGWHGIIASQRCDHGVMRNNVSWSNGLDLVDPHGNGIMLHRSCNDWIVENNQSLGNADSGIAVFASDRNVIRNNLCLSNANAGIRLSVGASANRIENNEFGYTQRYGFYLYEGNDPPEPDSGGGIGSGRCAGNVFTNNYVHDYTSDAVKLQNGDENLLIANVFVAGNTTLTFSNGTNNVFVNNFVPANVFAKLVGNAGSVNSITFKRQPRLAVQLDAYSTAAFTDDAGAIFESDQTDITTVTDSTGSLSVLTSAVIGTGANTIWTRNFLVVPAAGGVLVNPTLWNQAGDFRKAWTARASLDSIVIQYTVGDLQPGVVYGVRQQGALLATIAADAQGYIGFSAIPGTTTEVTYTVERN